MDNKDKNKNETLTAVETKTANSLKLKGIESLDFNQIVEILPYCDDIIKWAKDVQEYCLSKALNGVEIPGYKLVEGKSNRKWTNEDEVQKILEAQGFKEDEMFEKKFLSVAKIEKVIGKKGMVVLEDKIEKTPGALKLAPLDDKRKAQEVTVITAEDAFSEFMEGEK